MKQILFTSEYLKLYFGLIAAVLLPILLLVFEKLILCIVIRKKDLVEEYKQYKSRNKSFISESKFIAVKFQYYKIISYLFRAVIAVAIISLFLTGNIFSSAKYYDMYGNEYRNQDSVIFYDRNGNRYINDPNAFVNNYDTGEPARYDSVDAEGFLVDTTKVDESYGDSTFWGLSYNKAKTKFYYDTIFIYWNENGEMVFDNHITKIENVTPDTNPYDYVK